MIVKLCPFYLFVISLFAWNFITVCFIQYSRYSCFFFQIWKETEEGYFMLAGVLCLDIEDVPMGRSYPRIMKCHYAKGSQQWKWKGLVRTGVS